MSKTSTLANERAKGGATFLDERRPGWEKEIALERLNMDSPNRCVLGQLFGYYRKGFDHLKLGDDDAVRLGFESGELTWSEAKLCYARLDDAWTREVLTRRAPNWLRRGLDMFKRWSRRR